MAVDLNRSKKTAETLLKQYCIIEPAIDPEWISNQQKVRVFYINFPEDVRDKISGFYDPRPQTNLGKGIIIINDAIPAVRKAFTIAHELGHVLLHANIRDAQDVSSIQFRHDNSWNKKEKSDIEIEADVFSANLLMPENMVKEYFEKTKNIELLSDLFGVSKISMTYRLKDLWLI